MQLRRLSLEEFRLYRKLDLDIPSAGLGVHGLNASGKSTLLEAIVLLSTTKSPRTSTEREAINWASGQDLASPPFARIRGDVSRRGEDVQVEIGMQLPPDGAGPLRKQVLLNGRPTRAMDAVGALQTVLFEPADLDLISGSPSIRRRYLDTMVCQVDRPYLRALSRYGRILEQRNSLLKNLQRDGASPATATAQLSYWDEELVTHGAVVVARRVQIVEGLAEAARTRFATFTGDETLTVRFASSLGDLAELEGRDRTDLTALTQVVARTMTARLAETRRDEIRRGVTLTGPHRDDIIVSLEGRDMESYGSRGQQRLAVVALKLAESDVMERETGERPLLLLDDVMSELDAVHREHLATTLTGMEAQLIMTATDPELLHLGGLAFPTILRAGRGILEPA